MFLQLLKTRTIGKNSPKNQGFNRNSTKAKTVPLFKTMASTCGSAFKSTTFSLNWKSVIDRTRTRRALPNQVWVQTWGTHGLRSCKSGVGRFKSSPRTRRSRPNLACSPGSGILLAARGNYHSFLTAGNWITLLISSSFFKRKKEM